MIVSAPVRYVRRGRSQAAIAAVALTLLLWASAFVAIRFVGRELSPGPLALGRLLVGSIALGVVMVARSEPLPPRRALSFIVLCGLLWFGIYNVALNAAERRIDAGTTSLLVNTGPIFIALLAGALLHEGFPRNLLAGCAVAFTGVLMIALAVSSDGIQATWGAGLCLLAALAYAGGVVSQKQALHDASALSVTWLACTVGAIACLPFAPALVREVGNANTSTAAWTVYLGLGPTATGFLCWAFALARTDAGRLGATTYLVPPLVVLIGWITLGEVPPLLALPGGILCLLGVAVARRRAVVSAAAPPVASPSPVTACADSRVSQSA
jgi:drug/metabolite transporter (DMT)-like permease